MEKKIKIPNLRFPEFKVEWKEKYLGKTCVIKTGNRDTQNRISNGLYPFYVRSNTVERINSFSYDGEAILTSGDGVGVGKNFHYVNGKFDYHQRVYCLQQFEKDYSGSFIYHVFAEKFNKRVMRLSAKNSVDSVRMDMISQMSISFPSLEEQQKIASFLTAVDEKINLLQKKKQGLEQYKKGVMQQLFSQKLRFKKEDGSDYPDWEEKKLEKISKITIGEFVIKTKQNPKAMYPVYNGGKSYTGFYDDYNSDGDKIIISARGANAGFVNYEQGKFWAGNSCYSIDIIDKHTNNVQYMFYFIKFRQHMFTDYQQAANIPSVSKKDVQIFKIFCPEIQEQTEIANFLNAIDNKIDIINSQLENTQYFKKGLLQQMFV
mgnify:CR=1 FL=1